MIIKRIYIENFGGLSNFEYDFANDMTDGLIIYNKFGELVHLNDRLKVVLTEESLEGIKNLQVFEECTLR